LKNIVIHYPINIAQQICGFHVTCNNLLSGTITIWVSNLHRDFKDRIRGNVRILPLAGYPEMHSQEGEDEVPSTSLEEDSMMNEIEGEKSINKRVFLLAT
jgi:hypothetical protein